MKSSFKSFDENMLFSSAYQNSPDLPRWKTVRDLYSSFASERNPTEHIPKILHQIWLGGEVPDHYFPLSKKLREMHPDWDYRLWTDKNTTFDFPNREVFEKCTNMGQKSDILRYALLRQFGGVYLDMDFIAVRPMDVLLGLNFFAGITFDQEPQLANGLIGSTPENPLIQGLCQLDTVTPSNGAFSIMEATGPDFLTKVFFELHQKLEHVVALPNAFFYPYPNFPHDRILGDEPKSYFQDDTLCCHLWHCSWLKKPSNGILQRLRRMLTVWGLPQALKSR